MLLMANVTAVGGGLVVTLGIVSAVFLLLLIAAGVLMLVMVKRDRGAGAPHETPAGLATDERATPERAAAEEATTEEATPERVTTQKVTTEDTTIEEAATEEAATVDVPFFANDTPRLKKSFTAKLIQSSDEVKERYSQLKNAFLRYKRTNSRVSRLADSINCGRKMLGKFVIRGKTLCLYLALDPDDYAGTKYKVDRAAGKRYERVPCGYRIISARRAKYALDLIAAVAAKYSLAPIEREAADYRPAYEETHPLVARGLIRAGK